MKTEIEVIFDMAKDASKKDEEIKRLRGLLKESLIYVLYAEHDIGPWDQTEQPLSAKIEKEVSDE